MRFVNLVAFLAAAGHTVAAQGPVFSGNTLTVDEAVNIARQNNPTFLQSQNGRRTADAQVTSARGALLPSSSASFNSGFQQGGRQFFDGVALSSSSNSVQSSYFLGLNYSINAATLRSPGYQNVSRDATDADIQNADQQLRSQVVQAYITTLEDEDRSSLQDTLRTTAVAQLDLAKAKLAVGSGISQDVSTAEVGVGQADVAVLTARNAVQLDLLQLFQLMGVAKPDGDVRLTSTFGLTAPSFSRDSLITLAKQVNPGLNAQRLRETASGLNVGIAKASYLPSLSLSTGLGGNTFQYTDGNFLVNEARAQTVAEQANCVSQDSVRTRVGLAGLGCQNIQFTDAEAAAIRASNSGFPFKFNRNPMSLSAGISVPVFNQFSTQVRIEEAQIDQENQRYVLRGQELQLVTSVTSAYLTLLTAYRTVELQDTVAAQAREALTFAQERYRVGAAPFIDVTTAEGTFAQAQINRVNSIYDYQKAFAALEAAVGRPLR